MAVTSAAQFTPMVQQPIQAPSSDKGQLDDMNNAVDTSQVFLGSSQEKATAWRVRRGKNSAPSSANVGKGAISFDSAPTAAATPKPIGM